MEKLLSVIFTSPLTQYCLGLLLADRPVYVLSRMWFWLALLSSQQSASQLQWYSQPAVVKVESTTTEIIDGMLKRKQTQSRPILPSFTAAVQENGTSWFSDI